MVEELLYSKAWQILPNESAEAYKARKDLQYTQLFQSRQLHGHCYMIKYGDGDIRPMFEDKLVRNELDRSILSPVGMPLDCPLCQPYDHWDRTYNIYTERRYLTKIIDPHYPEGVVDKGGVWAKCPCTLKGADRQRLKFQGGKVNAD